MPHHHHHDHKAEKSGHPEAKENAMSDDERTESIHQDDESMGPPLNYKDAKDSDEELSVSGVLDFSRTRIL